VANARATAFLGCGRPSAPSTTSNRCPRWQDVTRPDALLFRRRKERLEDRRTEDQGRKLLDEFFDERTLLTISRMVTQGQFEALDYPVSTGKEGGVFRASGAGGFRAVKVYRIGNAVFKRLPAHALEELRREASDKNQARLIYAWTRREHSILRKFREAGMDVPEPYGYLRNVLVMDFIGDSDGIASPRLQELTPKDVPTFFDILVADLHRMVTKAHLVHGDLSPYNVLVHDDKPVLIDVAQAIAWDHPQARELLRRDVANFAKYFRRLGLKAETESMLAAVGADQLPERTSTGGR
jgi:RIO kinase 1